MDRWVRRPFYILVRTLDGACNYGSGRLGGKQGNCHFWICFWLPPYNLIFFYITNLKKVLSSTKLIEKSEDYDQVKAFLGEGLITSTGQHWHHRRKLITPAFHFAILETFIEPINAQAKILVKILSKEFQVDKSKNEDEKDGEFLDICPFLAKCSLDVICGN